VTRIEVDTIRGVNSGGVMQTLMELSMIRIVGRSEGIGKPMLFGTTREFLVHFGLKTLADLPKPRELEELLASGENKAEVRQQMAMELQDLQDRAEEGRDAEFGEDEGGAEALDPELAEEPMSVDDDPLAEDADDGEEAADVGGTTDGDGA
jgi:segregation and condensation protein B